MVTHGRVSNGHHAEGFCGGSHVHHVGASWISANLLAPRDMGSGPGHMDMAFTTLPVSFSAFSPRIYKSSLFNLESLQPVNNSGIMASLSSMLSRPVPMQAAVCKPRSRTSRLVVAADGSSRQGVALVRAAALIPEMDAARQLLHWRPHCSTRCILGVCSSLLATLITTQCEAVHAKSPC